MAEKSKKAKLPVRFRRTHQASHAETGEGDQWLTIYGDLMTLLLVFFVLFYTFSITGQLPLLSEALERYQEQQINPSIGEEMKPEEQGIEKTQGDTGEVIIYLPSKVLFDLGKANLKPVAYKVLHEAVEEIKNQIADSPDAQIRVEGYTDNIPIYNWRFKSNWELSAVRAVSVVQYLIEVESFPPYRLQAMGYGEYNPVAPNDTPENRQKNRRVELKIVKPSSNFDRNTQPKQPVTSAGDISE
ncbi:MAG: OmpA family protein [Candidatus Electryonea clarkiae]|nr:OmpA family protein [Candidatus Electryonea clarkiae]MDP8286052.1 OmpA family protein [Candidatus Electryonea clarkiae]